MKTIIFLICGSLWCFSDNCFSQLAWKTQEKEITGAANQKTVEATYVFQNKGKHVVNIVQVKPSCGCTAASLAKTSYSPGETGEIKAILTVGLQTGNQEKTILVETDDPLLSKAILTLKVHLPVILNIAPTSVSWQLGDPETPKMIKLKADPSLPVKVLSVFCDSMDIDAKLQVDKVGQEYTIIVNPLGTKIQARGSIVIETDYQQDGKNRTFSSFASIVPKAKSPP